MADLNQDASDGRIAVGATVQCGRRRRTRLSRGASALLGALLLMTIGESPAVAAGTGAPDVRACFTFNGGANANLPIYLYQWNGSTWVVYRSGKTNATGCGTWADVQGNAYYYARAYYQYKVGSQVWVDDGSTSYARISAGASDAQWALPTSPVYGPTRIA